MRGVKNFIDALKRVFCFFVVCALKSNDVPIQYEILQIEISR